MKLRSIILIILPLGLLLAGALAQRPPGPGFHPPTEEEKAQIRARIGISVEQQQQIEAIYKNDFQQERELRTRMHNLYQQLSALYDNFDFDRKQAAALRRQIFQLYKQRLALHAGTQEKLRHVLSREQFDRLTAMTHEIRERMRAMHPWPGRGPHGPSRPVPQ